MQIREPDWFEAKDPLSPGNYVLVGGGYAGGNRDEDWISPEVYQQRLEVAADANQPPANEEPVASADDEDEETPETGPPSPSAQPSEGQRDISSALRQLELWVPTEAVGAYVTIFALSDPTTTASKAVVFAVAACLTVFLTWFQFRKDRLRVVSKPLPLKTLYGRMALYLVAIAVYVSALSNNVFADIDGFSITIGGIVAVVAAILIPRIAEIGGIPAPGQPIPGG